MGYYDRYQRPGRPQGRGGNPEPEKSRSGFLGMLFNPQIGMSLRPLKETGRLFVHMVALIFSQAGLIDPRHPAVTGLDRKYGLFDVIHLAYQRVEWRQEKFASAALFVAVVGSVALCGLALAYSLFTLVFHIAA